MCIKGADRAAREPLLRDCARLRLPWNGYANFGAVVPLVMHCDYKTRDDARVSLFDYMCFTTGSDGTRRLTTRPRYRSRR